jgi:hypothetical protein
VKQNKDFVEVGRKDPETKSRKSLSPELLKFLHIEDSDLDGEKVDLDLLDDLLTSKDIDSEIDKISVYFMLMSSMAAHAQQRYEDTKTQLKKIFGQLDDKARNSDLLGRPTDAKVKAWIEANPLYQKIQRRINLYERQYNIFNAAARAFEMKSRMLQTKSANTRKMLGDIPEPTSTQAAKGFNKKKKIKGDK